MSSVVRSEFLDVVGRAPTKIVEAYDDLASVQQTLDQTTADEAGGTGYNMEAFDRQLTAPA